MDYINLGRAGVKVSRLALGLGLRGQADPAAAQRMIERAIDLGINFIDCANVYGTRDDRANIGQSERILSRVLQTRRDDLVITSKFGSAVGAGPNDHGASRYHVVREVERSLTRLGTDHLDVYLVHLSDPSTPLDEMMRALDDLVRSGKTRYIGCCNFAAWQVCRALWTADSINGTPFICVQNPYSLLGRRLETEMFPLVRAERLGVMAYSPLAIGLLSGAYHPDGKPPSGTYWSEHGADTFTKAMAGVPGQVIRTVLRLADEIGKSPAQLALAWILAQPEITCAIMGGDTIEHLEDNVGAVGWPLEKDIKAELDEVSALMRTQSLGPI